MENNVGIFIDAENIRYVDLPYIMMEAKKYGRIIVSRLYADWTEMCMDKWKNAGYDIPKIMYWNLAGYAGSPDINRKDIALVSGFSPSILTAVLNGEDFSPVAIMNRTIEKYKITIPKEN